MKIGEIWVEQALAQLGLESRRAQRERLRIASDPVKYRILDIDGLWVRVERLGVTKNRRAYAARWILTVKLATFVKLHEAPGGTAGKFGG